VSCQGCNQKIIEHNAEKQSVREKAQQLSNETKEWVGVYTDCEGRERYAIISSGSYPWKGFFTPQMDLQESSL